MRTKLVGLLLAGGLIAATLTSALACQYNMTTADNDKSSPPQTAQSDPPATPDKN
jgi:hypothetical protein